MDEDIELYESYFQKDSSYYLEELRKYQNGQKISFNDFASSVGPLWALHRKMYKETVFIFFFILFEFFIWKHFLPNNISYFLKSTTHLLLIVTNCAIMGFFGNYFYILRAVKNVQLAKSRFIDKNKQKEFLIKNGGTSFISVVIGFLLILALIFILVDFIQV